MEFCSRKLGDSSEALSTSSWCFVLGLYSRITCTCYVATLMQVSGSEGVKTACAEISLLFFAVGILYQLMVFMAIQVISERKTLVSWHSNSGNATVDVSPLQYILGDCKII